MSQILCVSGTLNVKILVIAEPSVNRKETLSGLMAKLEDNLAEHARQLFSTVTN